MDYSKSSPRPSLSKHSTWLNGNIHLPETVLHEIYSSCRDLEKNRPPGLPRPCKNYVKCSDKTKKRKIKYLLEIKSPEQIATADELIVCKQGKTFSAAIVKELSKGSSSVGTLIKNARKITARILSFDEALSMIVDAGLSTHQYKIKRERANSVSKNVLLS